MIKKIQIQNFRSILKTSVDLQQFTTVVGANATGKSNLIKVIDFISDISIHGLQEAVYKRGGIAEILPKQIKNQYNQEILIDLSLELEAPKNWSYYNLPTINAEYQLGFTRTKKTPLKITREKLIINSILLKEFFLENGFNEKDPEQKNKMTLDKATLEKYASSQMKIFKNKQNNVSFDLNYKLNKEVRKLFAGWIGFGLFFSRHEKNLSSSEAKRLFRYILNNGENSGEIKNSTIIAGNKLSLSFITQLNEIREEIGSYGRYDLLINELRQEQVISTEDKVSISGDNMPSVIKKFSKNNKEGWQRVLTTMSNISPYFFNVKSESLRAGKEYLVFREIFGGRDIEAWESSDGTLRALAILISVEAHKNGSAILIEEPEHGLHPWAIKDLILHIREVSKLNNLQVIITTHSQQVLECLEKNELLITERDENGTKYSTIDEILPNANISIGEIGNLWTKGLLKGVPTSL